MIDVFRVEYNIGDDAQYRYPFARFTTRARFLAWVTGRHHKQLHGYWTLNPASSEFPNGSGPELFVEENAISVDPE